MQTRTDIDMKVTSKTVVILALPGVQLLDVSGPLDVFAEANVQAGFAAYRLFVAAREPGPVRTSSGVRLMPDRIIDRDFEEKIDTLLVAGCPNAAALPRVAALPMPIRCDACLSGMSA